MAAPLNKEIRIDQPRLLPLFIQVEKDAVEKLKTLLTSPLILTLPRATGQYTVDGDVFYFEVPSVLLQQREDDVARPIGY